MQHLRSRPLLGLIVALSALQLVTSADPVVTIQTGKVRGTIMKATQGREFYAFRGIPFAKPPVGPLRFKDPVPIEPWTGEFNATEDSPHCAGISRLVITMIGIEDCLKINVYTPKLPSSESNFSLPVFFWIHGGGFTGGTASSVMYGPHRLLNKDIVVVSVYYRQGPLGFLNTEDDAAPGNAGLHDQHLGLVWVKHNIRAFGGDPARVTIAGESAGSASVSYHLLSPKSKGLFQAAIMQSGNAMAPWALEEFPAIKAIKLGMSLGCLQLNSTALVQCLQSRPVELIILTHIRLFGAARTFMEFVPSVEKRASGAMVIDNPEKLFKEGRFNKVPVISGVNRDEAMIMFVGPKLIIEDEISNWLTFGFSDILSKIFKTDLTDKFTNLTPNTRLPNDLLQINLLFPVFLALDSVISVVSDASFFAPNDKLVRLLGQHDVPVYMYVLKFVGDNPHKVAGEPVIAHAADLKYIWSMSELPVLGPKDEQVANQMVDMWVNFVNNLDPTPGTSAKPKWTRAYPTPFPNYLSIENNLFGQPYFTMNPYGWRTFECYFWNNIFVPYTIG